MRVLLTGANGFVGSRLLDRLLDAGHAPTLLLRPTADTALIEPLLSRCHVVPGALEDAASLDRACAGADAVLHVAGRTRAIHEQDFAAVNTEGTRRILDAANRQATVRHFVFLSSLAAAGPGTPDRPAREEDTPHPVSAYGRSKRDAEARVRADARMPWTVVRPPVVYGPHDREFLPLFRMAQSRWLPLMHTGSQPLSIVYVDDLARAVAACLDRPACHGKIVHAAHPDWTTPAALAEGIAHAVGRPRRARTLPRGLLRAGCTAVHLAGRLTGRPGMLSLWKWPELTAAGWVCDSRHLHHDTGFLPETGLQEGLRQTVAAYRAAGWLAPGRAAAGARP